VFKDVSGSVSKSVQYIYDAIERRVGKQLTVDNGQLTTTLTERYVLDRDQISLVFDGQGNQTHRYLYGTGIDQVLADETATDVLWSLTDHQGTVKDIVDNNGALVNHVSYDSFGNVRSQTNPTELRFAYTGRELDSESGLYYYRARYYDSAVGKFISEDPIGFNAGDSNLSRYVGNSSVNWEDPSGLDVWIENAAPGQTPLNHQKIVVGDFYGYGSDRTAFSYALEKSGRIWGFGTGIVYMDEQLGGSVENYMKTNKQQDVKIYSALTRLLGKTASYSLPINNCRKFSFDAFEEIKKEFKLIESVPPAYERRLLRGGYGQLNRVR
jgi:RHS repeat-associated protein